MSNRSTKYDREGYIEHFSLKYMKKHIQYYNDLISFFFNPFFLFRQSVEKGTSSTSREST